MRLGNAAWGFRETPLEKQLEITKNMGLDVLECQIANHDNDALQIGCSDAEIENVKNLYKKYGVELICAATGNDFTGENPDEAIESVRKITDVIDICAKLGVKYLRIFSGFSPVADVVGERWDTMMACINDVYEYGRQNGVVPVIETHGGVDGFDDGVVHFASTSSDPETLYKMVAEMPRGVMLNYDPANLYAIGIKNPDEVYAKIKDRVAYIHLKDFIKLPSGHLKPAACGESDMDWKTVLASIKDFDGPALIEYENVEDIAEGCQRSLDFINNLLKTI